MPRREPDWAALSDLQFLLYNRIADSLNAALTGIALSDMPEADGKPPGFWKERASTKIANVLNLFTAWSNLIRYKMGEAIPDQAIRPFHANALLTWLGLQLQLNPAPQIETNPLLHANQETLQEALLLLYSAAFTQGTNVRLELETCEQGMWFRVQFTRPRPLPEDFNALLASFGDHWRDRDTVFELTTARDFVRLNGSELLLTSTGGYGQFTFFVRGAGVALDEIPSNARVDQARVPAARADHARVPAARADHARVHSESVTEADTKPGAPGEVRTDSTVAAGEPVTSVIAETELDALLRRQIVSLARDATRPAGSPDDSSDDPPDSPPDDQAGSPPPAAVEPPPPPTLAMLRPAPGTLDGHPAAGETTSTAAQAETPPPDAESAGDSLRVSTTRETPVVRLTPPRATQVGRKTAPLRPPPSPEDASKTPESPDTSDTPDSPDSPESPRAIIVPVKLPEPTPPSRWQTTPPQEVAPPQAPPQAEAGENDSSAGTDDAPPASASRNTTHRKT